MVEKFIQPSLLPEGSRPKRAGFDTIDVDTYSQRVAAAAPKNPYIEQENRVRRAVGLAPEQADLEHGHGSSRQTIAVSDAYEGDQSPHYHAPAEFPTADEAALGKRGIQQAIETLRNSSPANPSQS